MENPFVHFNKMPEETDICFTGKENVNPSSLLLSGESSEPSPSFSMNSFNEEAMKSKRSCKQQNQLHSNSIILKEPILQREKSKPHKHQKGRRSFKSPHLCWSLDFEEWAVALLHVPKQTIVDHANEPAKP